MATIGSSVSRHGRSVSVSVSVSRAPGPARHHPTPFVAPGASRVRELLDRVRVLLDPPDTKCRPSALAHLLGSWRTFARSHVPLTDGSLALAVLTAGLVAAEVSHRSTVWAWLLTFLLALPLARRRRAPITVFVIVAVVAFAQWLANLVLVADVALLIALYTVAAHRPRRAAVTGAVILGCGAVLAATRWGASASATFASLSALVIAALASGLYVGARRAHVASLVERADRLEFERDQHARLATAAERARISREMHDVMAHSLAVMISLANGATAKLARDPEDSREALVSISDLGRQALDDTRRLLSVLRTEERDTENTPQASIDDIADLVDRAAATGLAATLTVRGDPVPVGSGLSLSAYRIVQEAITNTLKHAEGAAAVAVGLTWTPRRLRISVTDDGHGDRAPSGSPSGFGLVGMRERAALYEGTAAAGPGPEGGWTVEVTIPLTTRGTP